jgi:Leucine-rich repeat (LRR) protein
VPKSVTSVGSQFAANCSELTQAYLGRSMNYANNSYFDYFRYCNKLELLRVYAGTPPGISTGNTGYRTNCVLEVPQGQLDTYKNAATWNEFKEIREFESPEMLNDADFAMMQQMYNQLGGAAWTKPWDLSNQHHSNAKWNGVTTVVDENDDELYYISAIDLSAQGLAGQLPKSLFTLPHLKTVNLSHNAIEGQVDELIDDENSVITTLNLEGNHLTGDLYPFASKLTALTSLNVNYNRLTDISQVIPNTTLTNSNFYRSYQFIDYDSKQVVVPEDMVATVVTDIAVGVPFDLPENNRFQTYRHNYGDWNTSWSYMSRIYSYQYYYGGYRLSTSDTELYKNGDGKWDVYPYNTFGAPKNQPVAYTYSNGLTYLFRFNWEDGDVNGDQTVDVNDLQNVVYYALNDGKPVSDSFYNFTAADANADSQINVSDIIGCVNSVLNYEEPAGSRARIYNKVSDDSRNRIEIVGNRLNMTNADEVAALQLTISGAQKGQLSVPQDLKNRFSVTMRDVDGGVKVVVYSPMGNTMAPGQTLLLNSMPAGAVITDARLTSTTAERLGVNFDNQTTGIEALSIDASQLDCIYDLGGRRMGQWQTLPRGVYIIHLNGKQYKVRK